MSEQLEEFEEVMPDTDPLPVGDENVDGEPLPDNSENSD